MILHFSDGSEQTLHRTPAVWKANQRRTAITIATKKRIRSLELEGGIWMDADTTNNRWSMKVGER